MEINHDITSHKQAEESLRQAVAYNRSLIEASLDPLVTIDPKGMISDVNTATELVTGYSRENLIGTDFSNYFSDHQKARAGYKQVFKEGFVRDYALEIRHKDGQLTPVLYNASVYKDEAEKVIGVFAAARDIAEKSKLERQLRHSQTMEVIGTLAGGISHDFNNIIAGIIGLGEMVIEDLPKGDPNHRKLELILKGAFRGRDVIKQILAFSRQGEQEKKPVSMSLILSEAMPFIRASLPSTIEIRQNNYTKSDLIPGDKTQIHQVILNLCTNAAHAMRDRGGVLEISLKDAHFEANDPDLSPELKPGPYLNLTVSDTGCGIEPEVIERIFDPFYTTKSTGEGTGLGLSVVHGIVKSHNGIIKVYSQPGQGSAFHIFIPKMVSEPSEETEEISVSPGGHEHILVVDDEEILVEMGTQRLERLGYRATGKLSSLEALEVFRNEPDKFNLVVTDYTMPNMTGLELAKEMLRIRPDLPIVMCSGLNEPVPMGKIKEIGVKEFYVKPIEKDHFATLIRRVLDQAKDQNQKESR
jgi:PAS domain S-box-containing protein